MKEVGPVPAGKTDSVSRRDFMLRAGAMASGVVLPVGLAAAGASTDRDRLQRIEPVNFSKAHPLRLALIGTGARMTFGLLPAILATEGVQIAVCVDASPANLNRALERIERATGRRPQGLLGERDHLAVLRRSDIDAAFSACPCDLHAGIYAEALANGKHMYGEKPAAITIAETRMLREAWLAAKSILQIGFQRRTSARYIEGVRAIHSGEIGQPLEARTAWNNSGGPPGMGGWLGSRARSGDWMLEQACHTWDVLAWVAGGPPSRAYGAGRRDVFRHLSPASPARDMTDQYTATLEYPGGLLVSHSHTWSAPTRDNGAFGGVYERIAGIRGGIDLSSGRISHADPARPPRLITAVEPDMTAASVRHFFDCIREGHHPASSLDNGIEATLTGLLVRRAVDERRPVTMEELLAEETA